MYAFRMVGSPKCLRDSGALEVVRESIPKIAAISFFADLDHKCLLLLLCVNIEIWIKYIPYPLD